MSHSNAANMVIVDEFDVTCVIILITKTHIKRTSGWETPNLTNDNDVIMVIGSYLTSPTF